MDKKLSDLVDKIIQANLSSNEAFILIEALVTAQYESGDKQAKATVFGNMIINVLEKYHTPKDAVGLLSDLASVICIKNPDMVKEQVAELTKILQEEKRQKNSIMYG